MQHRKNDRNHILLALTFSIGILLGASVMAMKNQSVLKTVEAKVTSQRLTEATRMEELVRQVSGAQTSQSPQ